MTATVVENTLGIFSLCLTISFAKKNIVVNRQKNNIYLCAAATTICLLLLETATVYLESNRSASYVILMTAMGILPEMKPFWTVQMSLNRASRVSAAPSESAVMNFACCVRTCRWQPWTRLWQSWIMRHKLSTRTGYSLLCLRMATPFLIQRAGILFIPYSRMLTR